MLKSLLSLSAAITLLAALALTASKGDSNAQGESQPTGLEGAILLTKVAPENVGDASRLLAGIRTVNSLSDLAAAVGPGTNLIILDKSAKSEPGAQSLLFTQLKQGKALIGLNIPLAELRDMSDFARAVIEASINPSKSPQIGKATTPESLPFYSYVSVSTPGSPQFNFDEGQKYFPDMTFSADLQWLANGAYKNLPVH